MFGWSMVEYYALQATLVTFVLTVVLAVPYIATAVAIFLLPAVLYVVLDTPSFPMAQKWWFWGLVILAVVVGIRVLAIAVRKYPKRVCK